MEQQWNNLSGSYWYVPDQFLPALQMNATDTVPTSMIDQTVWQITGYRDGYFWGNCAALLYAAGTEPGTPAGMRMVGSVTPTGQVYISFMPISQLGAAMSTLGIGCMKEKAGQWVFEMQMTSGVTDIVAHWADMAQTKEGDPSWDQLPGTTYSVPDFLAAAGF